nr:MAG TPA: hypothetical protein [Caudoviricetes sp.]
MTATNKKIKIVFKYDRDEDGNYLNARLETPKGVHWLYDTTTEEAIVEALKDVNVELETDYDFGDNEEDYE